MIILGIDPGLRTSGYGVIMLERGQCKVIDAGTIKVATDLPMEKRLQAIYNDFNTLLDSHDIDIVAIEELYAHYKHPRTSVMMAHARGLFLLTAAQRNIKIEGYSATRVKKSLTGNGRATKEQMQRSVAQQLGLNEIPQPADVADALAIAMCCVNEYDKPVNLDLY